MPCRPLQRWRQLAGVPAVGCDDAVVVSRAPPLAAPSSATAAARPRAPARHAARRPGPGPPRPPRVHGRQALAPPRPQQQQQQYGLPLQRRQQQQQQHRAAAADARDARSESRRASRGVDSRNGAERPPYDFSFPVEVNTGSG